MKNIRLTLGAIALSLAMFACGAVFTQSASAQMLPQYVALRGEPGSAANLLGVKSRLENLIDQLNRDRHDYGGHRVSAIADMQQARTQLQIAIDYDATHGH